MNFSFLTDLKVIEVVKETAPKGKTKINRIPEGLSIRIYKNGAVYPSVQLTERFGLEYAHKNSEDFQNGFDIVNSNNWIQYPKDAAPVLFLVPVSKGESKVDLFSSVRYDENGQPKNSVYEQASKSEELLAAIMDIFSLEVDDYVDLELVTDNTLAVEVAHFPKTVNRGPDKGAIKTERRENVTMYPVVLRTNVVEENVVSEEVVNEEVI
jgi:hypothetical protein